MKKIITTIPVVLFSAFVASLVSLALSIRFNDVEWFQASGALVTIAGVLLAARKILRLGFKKFMRDERRIDGGSFPATKAQRENGRQYEIDGKAYKWSILLLVSGTVIWAYGGIILRLLGLVSS